MKIIEIIILGLVQGIGEFLPISSSAHLIIFRDLLGIGKSLSDNVALAFDVALHLGTLLAIVLYFFKDFLNIAKAGLTKGVKTSDGKLMWLLVLATIPGATFGYLFQDSIEGALRTNYLLIALSLAFMGVIIYLIDKYAATKKEVNQLNLVDAIIIGLAQVFALIPGFSRSGTTIAAGRSRNLKREDAAKFSFYLSVPIVLGAVLVTLLKSATIVVIKANLGVFILGILVAFLSGLVCIKYLLQYLKTHDFKIFMWYRIIFAIIIVLITIL